MGDELGCVELRYDRFEDFIDDRGEDSFVVVGSEFSVAISQRALEHSSVARVARVAGGQKPPGPPEGSEEREMSPTERRERYYKPLNGVGMIVGSTSMRMG